MNDPIVDEIGKHRMEHARKFSVDLAAICKDLRRLQKASGHKVVRRLDSAGKTETPRRSL
jgi:hypothetical protein